MTKFRIRQFFEVSDEEDMWEESVRQEASGENLDKVTDDAIANIGDWQRFQEAEIERKNSILPDSEDN